MEVVTDSIEYTHQLLGRPLRWDEIPIDRIDTVGRQFFKESLLFHSEIGWGPLWKVLYVVDSAPVSQFDVLIELARRRDPLPSGLLCAAATGTGFHGFRGRPWKSRRGNIHLSVFFAPGRVIEHFGGALMALPAVSVMQALDRMAGLENRSMVKWVNDILIDEAKVCGVLAHSQTVGKVVSSVVLGVGVNVETVPPADPDPSVHRPGALRCFVSDGSRCNQAEVFEELTRSLETNYTAWINGRSREIIAFYRHRSWAAGKEITICLDDACREQISGRVTDIGDDLELYLEGRAKPVTRGRIRMTPPGA